MPRRLYSYKPLIYVFCEGESEQAYTLFLKETFENVVVIKPKMGLFSEAQNNFKKDTQLRSYVNVIDEIWFFFDVEESDRPKLEQRFQIIQELRKLRKNPHIRVRLLMTTACIEYWFLLHYRSTAPHLSTVAEKEAMLKCVQDKIPGYHKGDKDVIFKIAENYHKAVKYGQAILVQLLQDGMPTLEDTDERNRWLCQSGLTFTTVHEAIQFLESKRS
ncbi:MAG TPA: RloB family protein [Firmicutes bacterium]|nr:RloB family protein [Bacillota bacterium]